MSGLKSPHEGLDLILDSPDGESRGLLFRTGDVFPLLPHMQMLTVSPAPASCARPWGLRHLVVPLPRAGAHEGGGTRETSSNPDGSSPEEVGSD